uniref:Uncharacterized protein n=1 Tax=Solanum lycopersicum TaxID=4081 RepID=A0A3Q7J967_SOLLC
MNVLVTEQVYSVFLFLISFQAYEGDCVFDFIPRDQTKHTLVFSGEHIKLEDNISI